MLGIFDIHSSLVSSSYAEGSLRASYTKAVYVRVDEYTRVYVRDGRVQLNGYSCQPSHSKQYFIARGTKCYDQILWT